MANQLGQIDHIVMLMLENRSFDHMLGFLYSPQNVSPAGDQYAGLTGNEFNLDSSGNKVGVFRIDNSHDRPYFMPGYDPREGFEATNQQLYGSSPVGTDPAPMSGFVTSFENAIAFDQSNGRPEAIPGTKTTDIMGMYDPSMLPVMSALARNYAVCDHWFASVPTETFPNRAFALTGTSLGHLKDDFKILNTPSIFGRMSDAGLSWMAFGYNDIPYVRTDYPDTKAAPLANFGHFADFQQRAKAGTLPAFSFLEPSWGATGNSQHPVTDVSAGEKLIYDTYVALQTGAKWNKTLFILTYDEHGGNYDHVPPPTNAVAPDGYRGDVDHLNFDFTRFGVRVPALLVSPLIKAGTVFRPSGPMPIDHTSVLATLRERWPAIKPLTKRDQAAPSLGDALQLATPRTDAPLADVRPPVSGQMVPNASRPSKLQVLQAGKVANLSVPNQHGTYDHVPPPLDSANSTAEYIRDRTAAWELHRQRLRGAH